MIFRTFLPLVVLCILQLSSFAESQVVPLQRSGSEPYFASPRLILDAIEYDTAVLQIDARQPGNARLFFATSYDPRFEPYKSLAFTLKQGTHTYYLDFGGRSREWMGWISGLVLVPEIDPALIKIRSASLGKGDIFTVCLAAWQEFMQLETIKGLTVNLIRGQTVRGRPVNYYAYSLMVLAFFFIMIRSGVLAYKQGWAAFWPRLRERLGFLVLVALAVLAVLEMRMWCDHLKIAGADRAQFWGKTLDEKRDLTMGGNYYEFMRFSNKVLPERVDVAVSAAGDFYRSRGPYYLYPHRVVPDAPYLIVFYKPAEKEQDYAVFAKFAEGAYILKKK
ncbi:MAG: hypothetical protein JW782_01280 [Candidatus Saganbacteria bacterium]|nr:hypothetical protein [Candidatus Saganbacteria bacterium]